jgi:8-oxo-dGTP pyrophosphatase MutT (NUDIX family)
MKYRKGIFIVIYRKKDNNVDYLLLKRKLHWKGWEFPKGGSEEKESVNELIKREIKEETGQFPINIKKYPVSGRYRYHKELKERSGIIGQTYKLYSAEIKKEKVRIDKLEHSSYKWANFQKAIKLLTFQNQRKCLRMVNKKLTEK